VSNEEVMNYELYGKKRGLGKFLYKFGQCCVKWSGYKLWNVWWEEVFR